MKNINQPLLGLLLFTFLSISVFANEEEICIEEFYPAVKIKNNTGYVVTGKVYYASIWVPIKGQLCKNDSYTIQPWSTWSHSRGECLITKITSSVNGKSASSYTSSGTSYSTFQVTATSNGYKVYRTGKDWDEKVSDGFTKAYYSSVDLVNDATKRASNAADAVAKNTKAFADEGIDVTSKEFKDLSKEAEKQLSAGVEIVGDAAKDAYEWAEKNACRLAVTTAISAGVVAYFTPKPSAADPGTVTSVTMSAAFIAYMKGEIKKGVAAQTMAMIATESFMLIPGVEGNVKKRLLQNVIANSISSSLDCVPCWGTPAAVGIAIGGGVAPLIAEYVCADIIPKGYSAAVGIANRSAIPTITISNTTEYRVEIDACHTSLNNEGTGGTITVEFWSGNKKITSASKKGVAENCSSSDAKFVVGTLEPITHVFVKTNSGDAFYIDELRLFKDGKLDAHHGRDNGSGWCLSTQAGDANGSWAGRISDNTCKSSWRYNYKATATTTSTPTTTKSTVPKPTPPNAANFDKTTVVQLKNYETKRYAFSTGEYGEKEGGWLKSPDVVGADGNYYNRANWYLIKSGTGYVLRNQETYRYLFSTGAPVKGSEGGWLKSPDVVGTDVTYYNRAIWDLIKQPNGTYLLKNRETKRYLFSAGDPVKGKEGGWLNSPAILGTDGNYYNRALWYITGAGTKLLTK